MFKLVRPVGAILLVGVTAFLVAADPPKEDAAKKDLESIQGTWKIVMLEADGEQAPAEIVATVKLVFKDDKLTFTPGEPGFTNYTYKLDPTAKPATFDFEHTEGAFKGKVWKGIYAVDGDTLTTCDNGPDPDKARPTAFEAKRGSGYILITFQRAKP